MQEHLHSMQYDQAPGQSAGAPSQIFPCAGVGGMHMRPFSLPNLAQEKCDAAQGSGWGWLGYSKEHGKLIITTSPNQDPVHLQVRQYWQPALPPPGVWRAVMVC